MKRLFVAINLPTEEKQRLHKATAPLREAGLPVRWTDAESVHLTLKFLGKVRPEETGEVEAAMRRVAEKTVPFTFGLGGIGAFPTLRRPRVLWVGAEATPELRCLKHDLEWEFASLDFEREVRAFRPHLTLGRATDESSAGDFRGIEELTSELDYEGTLRAGRIDLMSSRRSSGGANHERAASAEMGPKPEPPEEPAQKKAS